MSAKTLLALLVSCLVSYSLHAQTEKVIRIQLNEVPLDLEPAWMFDSYGYPIVSNIVEPLMKIDSTGKPAYGLASSHTVSQDGLVYRFKLRPDAKWSDGKPVTIADVRFGLINLIDPENENRRGPILRMVKGFADYRAKKAPLSTVGIRAENDELVLELAYPHAEILTSLALPATAPRREEFGSDWDLKMPTNGRYRIHSYDESKREYRLEPNPYNRVEGQLPIIFKVANNHEAKKLFDEGQLDILQKVDAKYFKDLSERNVLKIFPSTFMMRLVRNSDSEPLKDVRLRRALLSAIERKNMAVAEWIKPSISVVSENLPGRVDSGLSQFSDEVAFVRSLPEKASLTLMYLPAMGINDLIVSKIVEDVRSKLGIEIKLKETDWKNMGHGEWDLRLASLETLSPISSSMLDSVFFDSEALDSEYAKLISTLQREQNLSAKLPVIEKAQRMAIDNVASIPLVDISWVFAAQPQIRGLSVNPYYYIPLSELRKD